MDASIVIAFLMRKKIHEWIDDENGQTAVCPFCGIDSVIPETVNNEYKLTKELLQELNRRFSLETVDELKIKKI